MNGLDRLLSEPDLPYSGSRVGFLGHHSSVTHTGQHTVDALKKRKEWTLVKLFSPEHGFFGKAGAGEKVQDSLHPEWNLPVHSLYGEHRSPPDAWLEGLDLMVIDLQDLGVRCYTYASTLALMLQACANNEIRVLVLDRPTPLAGWSDGPNLDNELRSFVGMIDLPVVFGLSQGHLAHFLKSQESSLKKLRLDIIFGDPKTKAPENWIPPSPAIVSSDSAKMYPMTVWCEAIPQVWVDRGGSSSFQVWCMPDFPEVLLSSLPRFIGIQASPIRSKTPEGEWSGLRFDLTNSQKVQPVANAVGLLCALRDELGVDRLFNDPKSRPDFFDQLMGTSSVREQIQMGWSAEGIVERWRVKDGE